MRLKIVVAVIIILFPILACVDFHTRKKPAQDKKGEIVKDENRKEIMSFNGKDPINIHAYISRLVFSVGYFALGFFILFHYKEHFFYPQGRDGLLLWSDLRTLLFDPGHLSFTNDWPRLVWCGGVSIIGFSTSLPYFPYFFYYPVPIFLISCLAYSVLSLNPSTRGHVFYPLSIAICGTLGVSVDKYWDIATALLKR